MIRINSLRHSAAAAVLAAIVLAPSVASAQISGFNGGIGWTENDNGNGGATFSGNSAQMTNNTFNDATSVWFSTTQASDTFAASFTYQLSANSASGGLNPADGVTFTLQGQGTGALGGAGGGLGYSGISPSVAVALNVFSGHTIGTTLYTNGSVSSNYNTTGSVNLRGNDPILVQLIYDGSTLTQVLTDTTTAATNTMTYSVDVHGTLGGSIATVGFTAGTGGGTSIQTLSNFAYGAVPEPAPILALGAPALLVLLRRRK